MIGRDLRIRWGRSIFALITAAMTATWALITTNIAFGLDRALPIVGRLAA
jgi:hypothetical protein